MSNEFRLGKNCYDNVEPSVYRYDGKCRFDTKHFCNLHLGYAVVATYSRCKQLLRGTVVQS